MRISSPRSPLCQREFAFGRTQALVGFGGVEGQTQRTRVGQADFFARHANQSARRITRVDTTVEHAREPVERGVQLSRIAGNAAAAHPFAVVIDSTVHVRILVTPTALTHDSVIDLPVPHNRLEARLVRR